MSTGILSFLLTPFKILPGFFKADEKNKEDDVDESVEDRRIEFESSETAEMNLRLERLIFINITIHLAITITMIIITIIAIMILVLGIVLVLV